jgi:hypothetical protein
MVNQQATASALSQQPHARSKGKPHIHYNTNGTVASPPKILQNNTKPAEYKND